AELFTEAGAASDVQAGNLSFAVDEDRLRDGGDRVLSGDGSVAVQGDGHAEFVSLEHRGDFLRRFFEIDGDKPHTLSFKVAGHLLDLRQSLQTRSAPC